MRYRWSVTHIQSPLRIIEDLYRSDTDLKVDQSIWHAAPAGIFDAQCMIVPASGLARERQIIVSVFYLLSIGPSPWSGGCLVLG
jgi:hypothetical protein